MTRMELERVLTLNRIWQPIATVVVKQALTLVFRGRARVVCPETYQMFDWGQWLNEKAVRSDAHVIEHDYIRTAHLQVRKPEVITLAKYAGYPNTGVPYSRRGVFERDNGQCQYCGIFVHKRAMTIDHVLPVSRGGATSWPNCVLACQRCNHIKSNRLPAEAGMALRNQPVQPTRDQLILSGVNLNDRWKPFLNEKHVKVKA
ncbi:MAG: HNH endonuclease [Planctomycetes bacterium]|nr:HNH endonuclease [Planctomycetota bacterium]